MMKSYFVSRNQKTHYIVKKKPRVPIQTYKWEDVRRARAKGGYPWTYLYKGHYQGITDPEEFTMEALRKSRSTSTIGKSEGVEIEEITTETEAKLKDEIKLTRQDDHSKHRLTPEPLITQDDSATEEVESENGRDKPEIVALESAESSDNISQYVDKEYKLASNPNLVAKANIPDTEKSQSIDQGTPTTSKTSTAERAKSEEPKRKRKLSIESSYSRISLSRLGVMKKLREAKEKMKIPKLSLSTSNLKRLRSKRSTPEKKTVKKDSVPKNSKDIACLIPKKVPSPVYIHVPLKPPPGQTDEFSYLEFGEKKVEGKPPAKPKFSFKSLGARVIQEGKSAENLSTSQNQLSDESKPDVDTSEPKKQSSPLPSDSNPKAEQETSAEPIVLEHEKSEEIPAVKVTPKEEIEGKLTEESVALKAKLEKVSKLDIIKMNGSSSESDEPVSTTVYHIPPSQSSSSLETGSPKKGRAKSAEPEKKRKLSIDSAYSRISLSKLGFLRKIKDRAEKLKMPKFSALSRSNSQKEKPKEIEKAKSEPPPEVKKLAKVKNEKPVYIHIPLKPPPGETDEFSYLEFGDKKVEMPKELKENEETPDTPDSPPSLPSSPTAVQFIILTAPSDDEILDDKIPETPSSDDTKFFDNKLEETLKEIAEEAVDKVSPATKRKNLPLVTGDMERTTSKTDLSESNDSVDKMNQTQKQPKDEVSEKEKIEDIKAKTETEQKSVGTAAEEGKDESEGVKVETTEQQETELGDQIESTIENVSTADSHLETEKAEEERIEIDEEDGLKSSQKHKPKELKSVLKADGSPVLKKKVSFKRRSRADPKDIDVKKDDKHTEGDDKHALSSLGTSRSMSADEEKTYLDQKIMKDTSLEDDYNKWSKSRDVSAGSSVLSLDVRCACQYFQSDSLLPKKVNPAGKGSGLRSSQRTPPIFVNSKRPTLENHTHFASYFQSAGHHPVDAGRARARSNLVVRFRDVSAGSSVLSLDVRCACQYFQSDSLLPKKVNPAGKGSGLRSSQRTPPIFVNSKRPTLENHTHFASYFQSAGHHPVDAGRARARSNLVVRFRDHADHEYEPVNPPPDDVVAPPAQSQGKDPKLHHPLTRSSFDNRLTGDEMSDEETATAEEMQQQLEDRYFNAPPLSTSPKPTETRKRLASASPDKTRKTNAASESAAKFQQAIKTQADKVKTKLQNIKRPNITLPTRPKFKKPNMQKFKIERPKINLPKMPDAPKINFRSLSLPRRSKQSLKQRQFSTESNAGDSKRSIFDFSTYPRIFKKKPADDFDSSSTKNDPEFSTVPKASKSIKQDSKKPKDKWGGRDVIRIPLHSEDSMDMDNDIANGNVQDKGNIADREDSVERRMASHTRYDEDIDDIDDAYQRENQEIHKASPFSNNFSSRWQHGHFHPDPSAEFREEPKDEDFINEELIDHHNMKNLDLSNRGLIIEELTDNNHQTYKVTDLDSPEDQFRSQHESFDTNNSKDMSSESSFEPHRRGVLEEINSDVFFLRQKGISQDDIDMGKMLSSEIREAFRTDMNALSQIDYDDEVRISNQSLPEIKKKSIKKPKRRKTPHASEEQVRYDYEESEDEIPVIPPCRPKRRSKRDRKSKPRQEVIPYQETIQVESAVTQDDYLPEPPKYMNIISRSDDEHDIHYKTFYENEIMEGKDQPTIQVTDPYKNVQYENRPNYMSHGSSEPPDPPPRRHRSRSLRSLTFSEQDSIMGNFDIEGDTPSKNIEIYKMEHEYIIPIPADEIPNVADEKLRNDYLDRVAKEPPTRPMRKRSRTRSLSRATSQTDEDGVSREAESLISENLQPCVEEVCAATVCDYMGYAIVDKQKCRDPPLPPPRTTPRRKKGTKCAQKPFKPSKFSTVPRYGSEPPVRSLRDYTTLGSSRPSEEKENIDITQYIEIEDEHERHLHSGEVIQKMRERPLPAPPRPPRIRAKPLRDVTSQENIVSDSMTDISKETYWEETEVSTQTEPLPEDFICEEVIQEETDRVLSPSITTIKQPELDTDIQVKKVLITPTSYTFEEETVTHGSLVVEPLDGAQILPDDQLTKLERVVPVTMEENEEISEVPEYFKKLKSPPPKSEKVERSPSAKQETSSEVGVLKTQKLQVSDLDVDRLTVNELLANKIIVSEIDSHNIQVNEIGSKSGALKVGEIELPPGIVQQLLDRLQSQVHEQTSVHSPTDEEQFSEQQSSMVKEEIPESGKKKTSTEPNPEEMSCEPTILEEQSPEDHLSETLINDPGLTESIVCETTINESTFDTLVLTEPEAGEDILIESNLDIESLSSEIPSRSPRQTDSLERNLNKKQEEITEYSEEPITLILDMEEPPQPPPRTSDSPTKCDTLPSRETSPHDTQVPLQHYKQTLIEDTQIETQTTVTPLRPPRHSNKRKSGTLETERTSQTPEEPDVDDEPPPRPPQPDPQYFPSQPPASFYALRAKQYIDNLDEDIPLITRRARQIRRPASESSSEEEPPLHVRRWYRSPEPSIPQLTGQLINACGNAANRQIKRLISHITNNVLGNADGKQDMHVLMIILLVLIAGLLLLSNSDGKTIHYHHWEYFNPPRDT